MGMIASKARNPIDMKTSLGTRFAAPSPKNLLEGRGPRPFAPAPAKVGAPRRFAGRCQKYSPVLYG